MRIIGLRATRLSSMMLVEYLYRLRHRALTSVTDRSCVMTDQLSSIVSRQDDYNLTITAYSTSRLNVYVSTYGFCFTSSEDALYRRFLGRENFLEGTQTLSSFVDIWSFLFDVVSLFPLGTIIIRRLLMIILSLERIESGCLRSLFFHRRNDAYTAFTDSWGCGFTRYYVFVLSN